jgi:transposase
MVQILYSAEFKKVVVQKYFSRGNRSLEDLSAELNVATSTIYSWVKKHKKYATNIDMKDTPKRPQDWAPDEKIRAFFDYENLSVEQQGEFIRKKGLHSTHISEWKKLCITALASRRSDIASRDELNAAVRRIKELECDLLRKDRALAETTALLVLKKKADLIWGKEDPR